MCVNVIAQYILRIVCSHEKINVFIEFKGGGIIKNRHTGDCFIYILSKVLSHFKPQTQYDIKSLRNVFYAI